MLKAGRIWSSAWWCAAAALIAAVVFFAVRGCAFMPWNQDKETELVRVTVTRDFGSDVLKDESLAVREGSSAMRVLQEVAEVETSYGGGFIHAVDGLASGYGGEDSRKLDWFYYLNGQMADAGAEELEISGGDWLVFDYHSWEYSTFTPALAGCFPEPFVHGYREPPRECSVVYAAGWEEEGGEFAVLLREAGAPSCTLEELSPDWRPREEEYSVVIGACGELAENDFLADANGNARRLGLRVYLTGDDMLIVGENGEVSGRLPAGTGLVEAVGPRLGEDGSALMVTGIDREGTEAALALLADWDSTRYGPVMVMMAGAGGTWMELPLR